MEAEVRATPSAKTKYSLVPPSPASYAGSQTAPSNVWQTRVPDASLSESQKQSRAATPGRSLTFSGLLQSLKIPSQSSVASGYFVASVSSQSWPSESSPQEGKPSPSASASLLGLPVVL